MATATFDSANVALLLIDHQNDELQKTRNRVDALRQAQVQTGIFPEHQLLTESDMKAQEIHRTGAPLGSGTA